MYVTKFKTVHVMCTYPHWTSWKKCQNCTKIFVSYHSLSSLFWKKKKTVQRKREQKGFRGIYKRLPSSASFSFLYTSGTNLPRDSTTHSGLSPPTSIIDQDNVPQTGPQVNRSGQFLSRFSLCPGSRLTISKLTSTSVKISCPKAVFIRKWFM